MLVYTNAGESERRKVHKINLLSSWATSLPQNCNAPAAGGGKKKKKTRKQDLNGLASNLESISGCWKKMWEKLLREGPRCFFHGQFAYISMPYVKSKTPSHFNNTLNCLRVHRRSWCLPV